MITSIIHREEERLGPLLERYVMNYYLAIKSVSRIQAMDE